MRAIKNSITCFLIDKCLTNKNYETLDKLFKEVKLNSNSFQEITEFSLFGDIWNE